MTKAKEEKVITKTPSGFSVVAREFKKDKGAFAALITLSAILIFVVLFNIYVMKLSTRNKVIMLKQHVLKVCQLKKFIQDTFLETLSYQSQHSSDSLLLDYSVVVSS